jgi:hypothetical protein
MNRAPTNAVGNLVGAPFMAPASPVQLLPMYKDGLQSYILACSKK